MEVREFWKQSELRIQPGTASTAIGLIPYDSLSGNLGGFREKIMPGAFAESLADGHNIFALWSHDSAKPLCSSNAGTLRLRDTVRGLSVEMDLDPTISWCSDALRAIKTGSMGLSFGFTLNPGGDSWSNEGTLREVHSAKISEISPVVWPAYSESKISARQRKQQQEVADMARTKAFFNQDMSWKNIQKRYGKGDQFSCTREFLEAVMETGDMKGQTLDPRLQRAGTGLKESPASDGGFLLPSNLIDSLLFGDDASGLLSLCDKNTITEGMSATFPGTDEQTRVTGSQLGGLACSWGNEGGSLGYVNPTLNALELNLKKLKCYIPVSDELFESGPLAENYLKNVGRRSIAYAVDEAIYRGSGVGMPLGVLNAPCTIEIPAEMGQSADTISAINCRKMTAHLPPESLGRDSLCFLVNPELFEMALTVSVGVGGSGAPLISL